MRKIIYVILLLSLTSIISCKKSPSLHGEEVNSTGTPNPNGKTAFVHPGILHTTASLNFVKDKSAAADPWMSSFDQFKSSQWASLSYVMRGPTKIATRDAAIIAADGIDYKSILESDCYAIYCQALMFKLTGNVAYADKAVTMLNAWSSTLTDITGADLALTVSFNGFLMVNGAELLRDYSGWKAADLQRCKDMFRNIWYPKIKNIEISGGANGTWDSANTKTVMAFGIFLDDEAIFNSGYDYFYKGAGDGTILHYFLPTGQTQESGRNQGYAQLGLANFEEICEIGYNQGKSDMWKANGNILMTAFEYLAKYNLGNTVPFSVFPEVYGKWAYPTLSDVDRGNFKPIYRMAYNEFHNRLGMDMPFTKQVIQEKLPYERTHQTITDAVGWGTLFFYNPPAGEAPLTGTSPGGLTYEFNVADSWQSIWGGKSSVTIVDGKMNIAPVAGSVSINAMRTDIILDGGAYPYIAVKVDQLPAGVTNWSLASYVPIAGDFNDYAYPSTTAIVKGGKVYIFKWDSQKSNKGLSFPTTLTSGGGLYLKFNDCTATSVAKVDWIRSYKTLAEVPEN